MASECHAGAHIQEKSPRGPTRTPRSAVGEQGILPQYVGREFRVETARFRRRHGFSTRSGGLCPIKMSVPFIIPFVPQPPLTHREAAARVPTRFRARCWANRDARTMMVRAGLALPWVGHTLPSARKRFGHRPGPLVGVDHAVVRRRPHPGAADEMGIATNRENVLCP